MDNLVPSIIAKSLEKFIGLKIQVGTNVRRFFRLDGFDDASYKEFLSLLDSNNNKIAEKPLEVRTSALIQGFERVMLEVGKSATWYRNHVAPGHALILIFNERTSDSQSLKDIFPVTEDSLATDGLDCLLEVAFNDYQLSGEQRKSIKDFVYRLRTTIPHPQLRDLVAFFAALNTQLYKHPGTPVSDVVSENLPLLGLFRCREFSKVFNTGKGDHLLKEVYRSASLRSQLLDDRDKQIWLKNLEEASFEDDSLQGGASPSQKRALLKSFLTDILADRRSWMGALQIDWSEVSSVLYKKVRKTKPEKLKELYEQIQVVLDEQLVNKNDLPISVQQVIEQLSDGKEPESDELGELLDELGDNLPVRLKNQIKKLRGTNKYIGADFVTGLIDLAIQMRNSLDDNSSTKVSLQIIFEPKQFEKITQKEAEALMAFRTLYGGIEKQMPAAQWQLSDLWVLVEENKKLISTNEIEEEGEQEKTSQVELLFKISLQTEGDILDTADLCWQYRSDGPLAMTFAHVQSEWELIKDQVEAGPLFQSQSIQLRIPIYNTSPESDEIGDIDLSQPFKSLGVWYQKSTNLHNCLKEDLKPWTTEATWKIIDTSLNELEISYAKFINKTVTEGILSADLDGFLDLYSQLLNTSAINLQKGREILYGFRLLTQAWIVGPAIFENWVVLPNLHPIKLLWWKKRLQHFNEILEHLMDNENPPEIVDDKRFRQELAIAFSSANYPAVLALPDRSKTTRAFLPVQEYQGYEIFRQSDIATLSYGMASDLIPESESEQAAKVSAREISRVILDYIETYPFASDGLEIYIVQCKNSAFPGYLVEQLAKVIKGKVFKLNLVVHVTPKQGGAPLYRRIMEWLKTHEEYNERPGDGYFPKVSLKVLECTFDDLMKQPDGTNIVILPDVLAERGQKLRLVIGPTSTDEKDHNHVSLYQTKQNPFERGEFTRSIELTPAPQATLIQNFYNILWASLEQKSVPANQNASFRLHVSLQDWEEELKNLHERFNWVICYDTTVDRFLLEDTLPGAVEVIRYSLGLGIKRRHNLTVSSSQRTHDIVVRRLTKNLEGLLPGTKTQYHEFRLKVATQLVKEAKNVSGDIVLRSAGPGAYLNEMIGMVAAKFLTEKQYREQYPDAMTAWIYLDDFAHWFDHKRMPDLLFVAIPTYADQTPVLHIELLETKCVGEISFSQEVNEAQQQVAQGINRLFQAWQPGNKHLDAQYWYDQLYHAVVGSLVLEASKDQYWDAFKTNIPNGNFILEMSGHSWVFCYDGPAGIIGERKDGPANTTAQNAQNVSLAYHHFGRTGLRKVFQQLVDEWQYEHPVDIWKPQYEEPIPDTLIATSEKTSEKSVQASGSQVEKPIIGVSVSKPNQPDETKLSTASDTFLSEWLQSKSHDMTRSFRDYSIQTYPVTLDNIDIGPSVIRFKVRLRPGENLSRLQRVAPDLQRELALDTIPMIENVRGTHYVGVDLPHPTPTSISLSSLLPGLPVNLQNHLTFIVGQTPDGQIIQSDLAQLPHLLVAGSTGSGKTVFLYSFLVSLLHQFGPDALSLLLIDPKQTDFVFFEGLPHLFGDHVIIEPEEAITQLTYLMNEELNNRTNQLRDVRARDIHDYNTRFADNPMKFIVVVIDEYADLVQVLDRKALDEFERQLTRLAQRARNIGIHLVIATQRPSADIVTSRLKTNLTARIAFRLPSHHDSQTILDQTGAENLIGKGDMLFKTTNEVVRIQSPYISSLELSRFVDEASRNSRK